MAPIPHDLLIHQEETTLEATNLTIGATAHSLTRDGMRYFGLRQGAVPISDDGTPRHHRLCDGAAKANP